MQKMLIVKDVRDKTVTLMTKNNYFKKAINSAPRCLQILVQVTIYNRGNITIVGKKTQRLYPTNTLEDAFYARLIYELTIKTISMKHNGILMNRYFLNEIKAVVAKLVTDEFEVESRLYTNDELLKLLQEETYDIETAIRLLSLFGIEYHIGTENSVYQYSE